MDTDHYLIRKKAINFKDFFLGNSQLKPNAVIPYLATLRTIMDADRLEQVMKELQTRTKFHVLDFVQLIPFPAAFGDVGRLNKFNTKQGSVLLKQLLKQPKQQKCRGTKRKLTDSAESLTSHSSPEFEDSLDRSDFEVDLSGDMVQNALDRLNSFLQRDNMLKLKDVFMKARDEGELEVGLGIHLISKLAGSASTSPAKSARSCPCGCGWHLEGNEKIWIGSENTWYGELDLIAGNPVLGDVVSFAMCTQTADVVSEDDEVTENSDDNISNGPGDHADEVNYEIQRGLNQIVAQAVVFGFTEFNRHNNLSHFIPSILIYKTGYYIAVYSPATDVCLLSNFIVCGGLDSGSKVAYVLLWIILNHRIFFSKSTKDVTAHMVSHFKEKINGLENYQTLSNYSRRITQQCSINLQKEHSSLASPDTYIWFENL